MNHFQMRNYTRQMNVSETALDLIASRCPVDTAIIFGTNTSGYGNEQYNKAHRDRNVSNGDLIVVIVRNRSVRTIMYRRSDQPHSDDGRGRRALRVEKVVDMR